jgi:hypothetical protein
MNAPAFLQVGYVPIRVEEFPFARLIAGCVQLTWPYREIFNYIFYSGSLHYRFS